MSSFIYNMTDVWDNAAVTWNAIKMNVTDTASDINSKLIDMQVNGISKFNVSKNGEIIGNVIIANSLSGTVTTSLLQNGNSNIAIEANGNISISATDTPNSLVITSTGANIIGTLNATGNANVGNIGATRGVFTNIAGEGGNISNVQGANVSGTVASATTAGTVTTDSQPNITSVGNLTSLNVTGNVSAGNLTTGPGTGGSITGANLIAANSISGTIITPAQTNITSVGNLTSLNVTGSVIVGSITSNGTISLNQDYTETVNSQTGTNFAISLANGTIHRLTTTGNTTITLPSSVAGKSYVIIIQYGGAHSITWSGGTNLKWAGNLVPIPTSTLDKIDIFSFFCDGVNTYGGTVGQNF